MDQCIVVTGASNGIGRAIANLFCEKNFPVVGIDLVAPKGKAKFQFMKADVSNKHELAKIGIAINAKNHSVLAVINNAAVQVEKGILETTEEEWDRVLSVNLKAIMLTTQSFFPFLKSGSSIVNLSSVHARATSKGMAAYVASKGAISALTRAMALELGEYGIRVNAINPGAVDTAMLQKGLARNASPGQALKKLQSSSPLNKLGSPNDIANLALFLVDPELAGNITGQEFYCDGGVTAKLASE
ncbi:MAG: hypothetical protein A2X86_18585 [Bdellovibrionales bacterium GWA2_49_15]|nr:MAG: hypothetical protein A2X86_18585 [Bdellovibrionales bacterium GWA2_49_15]